MSLAKPSRDRRTLLGVVTSTFLDQVEREDFDKFISGLPGPCSRARPNFLAVPHPTRGVSQIGCYVKCHGLPDDRPDTKCRSREQPAQFRRGHVFRPAARTRENSLSHHPRPVSTYPVGRLPLRCAITLGVKHARQSAVRGVCNCPESDYEMHRFPQPLSGTGCLLHTSFPARPANFPVPAVYVNDPEIFFASGVCGSWTKSRLI